MDEHVNVFHIETTVNNRMFKGELSFLTKNEDDFSAYERMKYEAMRFTMSKMPLAAKRKMYNSLTADYEMIAVEAGRTEPVHERIIAKSMQQYVVPVDGQCDILICPIPEISPYNVYSSLNPLLVQVMALGYHFNMYRGKPLLKKGGVLILHHPCYDDFDHVQHPSYIEFFNRLLPETRDSHVLREKYEREFATNPLLHRDVPARPRLPRRAPVLHVVLGRERPRPRRPRHRRRRRERARPRRHGLGAGRQPDRSHRHGAQLHGPLRPDHDAPSACDRHLRHELEYGRPRFEP